VTILAGVPSGLLTLIFKDITIDVFSMSITEKTKLKGLLEIISSATEFENISIRRHEDVLLRRIYDRVPVKSEKSRFESPAFKTSILLQAHFSRLQLPPDLVTDQQAILSQVVNLLHACVDVMASNTFLNVLGAMDLAQMCVQGAWESDSPLKQIPHFEPEVVRRCKAAGIHSVYDLMEMDDDDRVKLLDMSQKQMYVPVSVPLVAPAS
jgi:pre-mRNA-splicing helicase BRR2